MPVMQVQMQLPTDELLRAVSQLNAPDLEQFAQQVMRLLAQRRAPFLPRAEADLLLKINRSAPTLEMQERCKILIAKRQAETLTPDEYEELLHLTDQFEALNAQRLESLVELARLRGVTLPALLHDLGIQEINVG